MKKKTFVMSILLVLTEIALVCYFAGCSTKSLKMRKSQMVIPSPIRKASQDARRPSEPLPTELVNISEDEIWIIAKPETQITTDEDTPGGGALLAKLQGEDKEIPLPLKHTDVNGEIIGYIATVEVTQQFHNPYDEKIEAVYVFPLPQNAAINEFIMTIGDR
ncbi:MAG: VIT domain-containing protein, partial [Planctomycetota bacterium]